ncbi:MAG: hypothetical protein ACFE8M_10530 [Candidatus Hermodarchaeota archaeon]
MITKKVVPYIVQREELFPNTIDEYLSRLFPLVNVNISGGARYPFELGHRLGNTKINPFLRIAHPTDAPIIADICKEVYENSYPYKEMEDEIYIRSMIESSINHFILFETESGENAGCFRCALDFEHKKGYMGGFMVRKKFQNKLDVIRAIMGSYIWMWNSYKDDILVWYCENRTAHASSQYITAVCGINTIAIFPNKDIFFGQIESDVMGIIYTENVLREKRSSSVPTLIPSALNAFQYSDKLFTLGNVRVVQTTLHLDIDCIKRFFENVRCEVEGDKYGYQHFKFTIVGTNSSFTFLHNTHIQNFEKANYTVQSLEELFVFIEYLKKYMRENNIRYCEMFISAYKPEHQQLFYDAGFRARGYVPCWKYIPDKKIFEDYIVFNYFEGKIEHIDLLPQGYELLNCIEV